MKPIPVVVLAAAMLASNQVEAAPAMAESPTQPTESELPNQAEFAEIGYGSPIDPAPRLVPWIDYTGDLKHRAALTGDWGGVRQTLIDRGMAFDVSLVQAIQRNVTGGTKYEWTYQGNVRYGLRVDTGEVGLWPGGLLAVRGETRFGRSNNLNTGALMPVNTASLFPEAEEDVTALMDLHFVQFLSPWLGVMLGKFSPREPNVFAHDETSQFMNTALNFNMAPSTTVPPSFLAVGLILRPTEWVTLVTQVLDSEGEANKSGFDTVFDRGTSVLQALEVDVEPFDLPGHQRAGWSWSDSVKLKFRQNPRAIVDAVIAGKPPPLNRQSSDWSFFYDFDQYLYLAPGSRDEGLGMFGRFGITDSTVNTIGAFYSIGLSAKGLVPRRDDDVLGVGYYYIALSDKLPRIIKDVADDEQGVELYYNIRGAPWLHITPDIQILDPAASSADTTVVIGLRLTLDF